MAGLTLGQLVSRARTSNPSFPTKKSLADACGVTLEAIRRLELGLLFPKGELLERIITELDMDEQDAARCWTRLAEHQLDDKVLSYVRLQTSRAKKLDVRAPRVARVVVDWAAEMYDVTDEDRIDLEEKIKELLKD